MESDKFWPLSLKSFHINAFKPKHLYAEKTLESTENSFDIECQ